MGLKVVGTDPNGSRIVLTQTDLIKSYHPVPSQNSADNTLMRDVIGNKTDGHIGTSLYGGGKRLDEHIHSIGLVYPTLADDTNIISAAGVWALGLSTEIVPVNTITEDYDLHFIEISNVATNAICEIHFFHGDTDILAGKIRFARTTNQVRVSAKPTQTVIIPANAKLTAKMATSIGANNADLSIQYHVY